MKLTGHISSQYMTAANALHSERARRRVVAYVESYDDVLFWRTVLGGLETESLYFEIMLPTRSQGSRTLIGRGKKSAIHSLLPGTGRDMIACVDADYDYLLQGATENSRDVLNTPYVFHTYAYAIENLQCWAGGLHSVCVMATLNDRRLFDFGQFLTAYSEAVWPLFCWSVALYRAGKYEQMTITDMDSVIAVGKLTIDNAPHIVSRVRSKAAQRVAQLRRANPDLAAGLPALRDDLLRLGLTPATTYLYIHGHHLFEKIVAPLVASVCSRLIREREAEIRRQSLHRTQMNNELSCYANSIEDIASMMKKSTAYTHAPVFKQIMAQFKVEGNPRREGF